MGKLSLEALKERAEAVASEELLNSISGGTEDSCHCRCDDPGAVLNEYNIKNGGGHTMHVYE